MERFKFHPKVGIERGYVGSCLGADTQQSPDISASYYRYIAEYWQLEKTHKKSETKKNG
jgi:hypothetical protein